MSDTPGSWQPDPYGRYAYRWWDGANWTQSVSDAGGVQHTDPLAPAAPTAPARPQYGAPSGATTSALPVPGLVIVGLGALCVLLSDFALNWFSSGGFDLKLSDLRDLADLTGSDLPVVTDQYLSLGWLVGLAAAGLAVGAVFAPKLRTVALIATAALAVWHGYVVYDLGTDDISPEFGAWLGSVGFVLCAVAVLLPRRANASRPT